ncbi:MAG: hypothetical protein ACYDER_07870 [Ktedonobacteraceae bacterium]
MATSSRRTPSCACGSREIPGEEYRAEPSALSAGTCHVDAKRRSMQLTVLTVKAAN